MTALIERAEVLRENARKRSIEFEWKTLIPLANELFPEASFYQRQRTIRKVLDDESWKEFEERVKARKEREEQEGIGFE